MVHSVIGICTLCKTVGGMLKNAKLDGFFTNHSLHHSGTSRLFQAGVDQKLIKEYAGHRSDVVDNYQVTSEAQRQELSAILAKPKSNAKSIPPSQKITGNSVVEVKVTGSDKTESAMSCVCCRKNLKTCEIGDVSGVINHILNACKGQKVTAKIEVLYDPQ